MIDQQNDYQQLLKALYDTYEAELPVKIAAIKTDWNNLKTQENEQTFKILLRNVHSLVGSGATFGFLSVSDTARQLQERLEKYHAQALSPDMAVTELDHLLDELEASLINSSKLG
jgi:chemotaxis protein histidine kinase CheA